MIAKKLKIHEGGFESSHATSKIASCQKCGGTGSHTHGAHNHTSSLDDMSRADCVIGFYPDGKFRIIKDRYGHNHEVYKQDEAYIVRFLLEKISDVLFNRKLQMFQTAFNDDVKKAFADVLEEHHLKVKGINE